MTRAVEPQKRGAIHHHVLLALPPGTSAPAPAIIQALALRAGYGCHVDVRTVTAPSLALVNYMVKALSQYMVEACDSRDAIKWDDGFPDPWPTYRVCSSSKGWASSMAQLREGIRQHMERQSELLRERDDQALALLAEVLGATPIPAPPLGADPDP
jgi:hypothetical protein